MKFFTDLIGEIVKDGFEKSGFDPKYGIVSVSNRPDLCEFQCNGAMAAAKAYKCPPGEIAAKVSDCLKDNQAFENVDVVNPGFINLKVSPDFLLSYIKEMRLSDRYGYDGEEEPKNVVIDYGGANVAKPLHVGHLRSAVIGESIKRIVKFAGNKTTADVHLGDWGLQMGLIIEQLKDDQPELVYFDEDFTGEYPKDAPFTMSELEKIYPRASKRSKEDEAFLLRAQNATLKLQKGYVPYREIWKHIMDLSKVDIKKNYDALNVSFDLWKGESDAQPFIDPMIEDLKVRGVAYESEGALVVDVVEETDKKEIPPCIIQKSDGASLYATSDLATIIDRRDSLSPGMYIYVADKRQELHFTQVYRTAKKAGYITDEGFEFIGFGTMNGTDGKPFKTREGGVMRLENLIDDIKTAVLDRMKESGSVKEDLAAETSSMIALSALKYGDLSNQASRDYIFDIDRFTSFEGNTGPYILYTVVRIKSILEKAATSDSLCELQNVFNYYSDKEKAILLKIAEYPQMMNTSYRELAPHKLCQYIYELSDLFNGFYHDTKILSEENKEKRCNYLSLLLLVKDIILICLDLLAIECPDRM